MYPPDAPRPTPARFVRPRRVAHAPGLRDEQFLETHTAPTAPARWAVISRIGARATSTSPQRHNH
ncbi:hypothetical protein ACFPM0_24735 [Pseudonocardia sulfidoxydans]|uniref:hypothetical protein n=1 Tax=Pseudonocardia sulfidoxydans TaxID=54011 RepID=UPI0036220B14